MESNQRDWPAFIFVLVAITALSIIEHRWPLFPSIAAAFALGMWFENRAWKAKDWDLD